MPVPANNYQFKNKIVIDISMWEKDIFWDRLSPRPVGVITKASEYTWTDPLVHEHCRNMTAGGFLRGIFHFFREDDVQQQIDLFLKLSREVGALVGNKWMFEFEPILDVEETPKVIGRKYAAQLKFWLDGVEAATGLKPMIYTSENYFKFACSFGLNIGTLAPSWTGDYRLWCAQYPDQPDLQHAPYPLPAGWKEWTGWQYAADARFTGVPYDGVDINVFKDAYLSTISGEVGTFPGRIKSQNLFMSDGTIIKAKEIE